MAVKTQKKPSYRQLNQLVDGLREGIDGLERQLALERYQHGVALKTQAEKLGKDRMEVGIKLANALGQAVQSSADFQQAMARLAAGLASAGGAF